ncbi:MAG: hypothetical protein JW821_00695 [Deltaproteobacteria bacterium]|nr:hypothetical protein [Deltaproteobacteria bacterium]
MKDLPVILFPHSGLSERSAKQILSLFGPLILCRPWFMEPQAILSGEGLAGYIRTLQPPEDLKPAGDFRKVLSEYRDWAGRHEDWGSRALFHTARQGVATEDATWEIRQEIRRKGRGSPDAETGSDFSLKWHLLLHLAREMERQREEADDLLRGLRDQYSPLRGALEEEIRNGQGFFQDLPHFSSERPMDETLLGRILEAWFGLFGGYVGAGQLLVTRDPALMEYLLGLADASGPLDSGGGEAPPAFRFPDLSRVPPARTLETRERILADPRVDRLRRLIGDLGKDPGASPGRLRDLASEVELSLAEEFSRGALDIRVMPFSTVPGDGGKERNGPLKRLSGKILILVGETESHEKGPVPGRRA